MAHKEFPFKILFFEKFQAKLFQVKTVPVKTVPVHIKLTHLKSRFTNDLPNLTNSYIRQGCPGPMKLSQSIQNEPISKWINLNCPNPYETDPL